MRFHTLRRTQWILRPVHEVFAFFSDARNLEEITPSWLGFRILTPGPIRIAAGTRIRYRLSLHQHSDSCSQPLHPEFAGFPSRHDPCLFKEWKHGRNGCPLVDAGMRELWHTGWMHNRVRMVVASFLVKHPLIGWRHGAAWFWDTPVDADLANNALGWQWVAGCCADAAPYFRIFNPAIQAAKFDPQGDYIRRWEPELKSGAGYPSPVADRGGARDGALTALASIKRQ